jgi:hypothetical protein
MLQNCKKEKTVNKAIKNILVVHRFNLANSLLHAERIFAGNKKYSSNVIRQKVVNQYNESTRNMFMF